MNKERMEQIEKLAAGFRKEWVPETDNEHRVLAYSDDRDEYDEVFEACNDAVAQGIIEMRTAIPELLAALRERDAVLSEREQQIIGRNAELIALHDSVYSLTSERDALREQVRERDAEIERLCETVTMLRDLQAKAWEAQREEYVAHVETKTRLAKCSEQNSEFAAKLDSLYPPAELAALRSRCEKLEAVREAAEVVEKTENAFTETYSKLDERPVLQSRLFAAITALRTALSAARG